MVATNEAIVTASPRSPMLKNAQRNGNANVRINISTPNLLFDFICVDLCN